MSEGLLYNGCKFPNSACMMSQKDLLLEPWTLLPCVALNTLGSEL
jgi:hypothetical protein